MPATSIEIEKSQSPGAPLRRMAMVLAVAYVLVLQALLGGLASGAHAAGAVTVDAFGQVLCLGSHGQPASPGDPTRHNPDCCLTGCQAAPAAALLPPIAVAAAAPVAHLVRRAAPPRTARLALAAERTPPPHQSPSPLLTPAPIRIVSRNTGRRHNAALPVLPGVLT